MLNEKERILQADLDNQLRNVLMHTNGRIKELTSQVRYMQGRYSQSDFNYRSKNHMELEQELDMFDELEDLLQRLHEKQHLNRH